MKLLKVGEINLDEALYLQSEFYNTKVLQKTDIALDGSEIVFLQENLVQDLSFWHMEVAWQSKATLDALISLANQSAGKFIKIITSSGELEARFDYSSGSAVSGEPIAIGLPLFKVTIKMKGA